MNYRWASNVGQTIDMNSAYRVVMNDVDFSGKGFSFEQMFGPAGIVRAPVEVKVLDLVFVLQRAT